MSVFFSVLSAACGLLGIFLMRLCRFVVTGPEDGYFTCEGAGGALTDVASKALGTLSFALAVTFLAICLVLRARKNQTN